MVSTKRRGIFLGSGKFGNSASNLLARNQKMRKITWRCYSLLASACIMGLRAETARGCPSTDRLMTISCSAALAVTFATSGFSPGMSKAGLSIKTGTTSNVRFADFLILGSILIVSILIGAYHAYKDRNNETVVGFLMADRNMHMLPTAASLLASFLSAVTILGVPSEVYFSDTMYVWLGASYPLVNLAAAYLFLPIFYELKIISIFGYLEKRFSEMIKWVAVVTFMFQMTFYMALVLYAPALAVNYVTDLSVWGSVWTVGMVCTTYTALGGMKGVMWTDLVLVGTMAVALVVVVIKGTAFVGGFQAAWDKMKASNRVRFDDVSLNPTTRHTVWSLTIGGFFTWIAMYGTHQVEIQHACTCPSLASAQLAYLLNMVLLAFFLYIGIFIGVAVVGLYTECDPLAVGLIQSKDQILLLFVMDVMGDIPGLSGLFVGCLFCATLSTVSSGLNSVSAVLLEDVIKSHLDDTLTESQVKNLLQLIALMTMMGCLAVVHVGSDIPDLLQGAMALHGIIAGPLCGLFSLGMFFPWANKWGALSGLLSSIVIMFWIMIGTIYRKPTYSSVSATTGCANITKFVQFMSNATTKPPREGSALDPFYSLSYMWYGMYSILIVIVVGLVVSFITGPTRPSDINPWLICPVFDIVPPFCYLPGGWRNRLRCGVSLRDKALLRAVMPSEATDSTKAMDRHSASTGVYPVTAVSSQLSI